MSVENRVEGLDPSVFVHPMGLCESDRVGPRTRIWAFAHLLPGAVVGADCNVGDHAFIEGGARLGDRVTVKNAVLVWDGVTVHDVADHALVAGNPARRVGWVCTCGRRLGDDLACACGRGYRLVDETAGLVEVTGG